jgi:hypothetical protein
MVRPAEGDDDLSGVISFQVPDGDGRLNGAAAGTWISPAIDFT